MAIGETYVTLIESSSDREGAALVSLGDGNHGSACRDDRSVSAPGAGALDVSDALVDSGVIHLDPQVVGPRD